jgi:hypothetical protein
VTLNRRRRLIKALPEHEIYAKYKVFAPHCAKFKMAIHMHHSIDNIELTISSYNLDLGTCKLKINRGHLLPMM